MPGLDRPRDAHRHEVPARPPGRLVDHRRRARERHATRRSTRCSTKAPEDIVEQVMDSGLRGRGGAGFGTGQKWSFLPKDVFPRYLAVNGDEGEPSTFKDHMLIEGDPHQLIEGIVITAYAIQAHHAFIYLRGEFALGAERLGRPSPTRTRAASSARTSRAPASTSRSSCTAAPAATSPVTRRACCRASRASARCRASSRRSPRCRACTPRPRSSTTSRRCRRCRTSCATAREWYAAMGVNRSKGTRLFSVSGQVERPGQLRGRARHHVPRPHRGPGRRRPRRQEARLLHPGRRVVTVAARGAPRRAARHGLRAERVRARPRCSARAR